MTTTIAAAIAAQAYGQVRGLHLSLSNLIILVKGETPTFHELLDLGCGIYASKDDVLLGLQGLLSEHGGIATMREVLEDEFSPTTAELDEEEEEELDEDDDDDWEDEDEEDDDWDDDDWDEEDDDDDLDDDCDDDEFEESDDEEDE